MKITRRTAAFGGAGALASATMGQSALAEQGAFLGIGEGLEDFWLATDAYIFGYPLVTMEMTRRIITNVAERNVVAGVPARVIKVLGESPPR